MTQFELAMELGQLCLCDLFGQLSDNDHRQNFVDVDAFMDRYESGRTRPPAAGTVGPYLTEQVELSRHRPRGFLPATSPQGPRAREEFKRAEDIWRTRT